MKISILYFDGCPNHPPVVAMAREVVAAYGLDAEIEEIDVAPHEVGRRRFLGSPTVQVDGIDIEPEARSRTDFAMSCRVYKAPDGMPTREMLLAALGFDEAVDLPIAAPDGTCGRDEVADGDRDSIPSGRDRAGMMSAVGAVVTAVLSSACCWLPLLLLAFGASAAGASAVLEQWRPVFIVMAIAMLGLGFFLAYFRLRGSSAGCCDDRRRRGRRIQRGMLWLSSVIVAAFVFFPSYVGLLLGADTAAAANPAPVLEAGEPREYVFDVEGMHCAGCAATLRSRLVTLDGAFEVQVDYPTRTARLRASGDAIEARVEEAASHVGYTTTLRSKD